MTEEHLVRIEAGQCMVEGSLSIPCGASGLVLFVHGSGSSRFNPRNQFVAGKIREANLGTLLIDLLTPEEEASDKKAPAIRFNINLLAKRLELATQWITTYEKTHTLRIGYFSSSTGAAAALVAAARLGTIVGAVVSKGGRPDLAGSILPEVLSPTLFIVGALDEVVVHFNWRAHDHLQCIKDLMIVPGATHQFEEPGALEKVAQLATQWFSRYLVPTHEVDSPMVLNQYVL